ncbi:hypothetical protein [Bacillus massiliigorillae]|uniref:hypothetical protein n=1 Tax=Bacillus massiliigorillae TaxID=1243664 RepID=UPI0003A3466E|nr:hypothetical protein [Bacillus massiliigorillae]
MTLAKLKKILDATGYPVAYSHFTATSTKPVPAPPYICYLTPYTANVKADNKVYKRVDIVQLELYTAKKDLVAEAKLEKILEENELPNDAIETYIESENLFQRIYEIKLF